MHHFLFGVLPYLAITIMVVGSVIRYDRDPFTWKSKSSQLLRKRSFVLGSVLFHVGVIVIFFGHLVGLLTPIAVFDALGVSHGAKQLMAIVLGGIAGVMALVGGMILLVRRFGDPRIRATSGFGDNLVIVMLVAQVILGLGSIIPSLSHLDGYEMLKFMGWAQGIVFFQPGAAEHLVDVHWIFKAHILLGLAIFIVFPFTRLVHMVSAPLRYLWRPGYQIVRSRRGAKAGPADVGPVRGAGK
ncbi:MAG: respiratory nitrate reductase subunit gamma [Tabrizicola sp.]|uniref:respiratory nitrate reductase subunit gamma n=1 Tax=Tabrizicola sp. TaxID=2005166 RepID=UPI002732D25B|nr:respiratory nitrate reductase subunit gamma [Tabrizicola sp.]MDP3264192.1 respiratory nitrate reductase subunit gamma [Tabrizicola sp.]MDZ4066080.1 respiratory nitrate reductase subunit gamma [Tabrizicola sp.]